MKNSLEKIEKRVELRLIKSMAIKEACRELYTFSDDNLAFKKYKV